MKQLGEALGMIGFVGGAFGIAFGLAVLVHHLIGGL